MIQCSKITLPPTFFNVLDIIIIILIELLSDYYHSLPITSHSERWIFSTENELFAIGDFDDSMLSTSAYYLTSLF